MQATAPRIEPIRYGPETWDLIKQGAIAGVTVAKLSKVYGPSMSTIKARADREQWRTPRRQERLQREEGLPGVGARQKSKKILPPGTVDPAKNDAIPALTRGNATIPDQSLAASALESLLALASAPPADFQRAVANVLQPLIAQGLQTIDAPRNIKELATLMDVFRKAAGLDVKAGETKPGSLVNPLRAVSRRASAVTVEVMPEADLGDPNEADWEV